MFKYTSKPEDRATADYIVEGCAERLERHRLQPFVRLGDGLIVLDQAADDLAPAIRCRIVIDPAHGTAVAPTGL